MSTLIQGFLSPAMLTYIEPYLDVIYIGRGGIIDRVLTSHMACDQALISWSSPPFYLTGYNNSRRG